MSCDKSVQTCEEDIITAVSETDCESGSESSVVPFYDRMNETDQSDLVECIYELIYEYIEIYVLKMAKPDFHIEIVDDICHVIYQQLTETCEDIEYEDMHAFVSHYCNIWFTTREDYSCPIRHEPHYMTNANAEEYGLDEPDVKNIIRSRIANLREKDAANPKQRTKEWYERRYNMMTASNIWQALGSDAQKNRFIYDKCKPLSLDIVESKWMSTDGSLHWGVKYEPLTVMVYERLTGARVELFGCISHHQYPFLGASPDGVVVNPESPLYGRLVEIKNIYNRDMDGIPSEAYWIQIQAQIACCDLDFCDFVETRFKEYESEADYIKGLEEDACVDADKKFKGVILHMVPRDGRSNIPLYQYMPLDISDYLGWIEETKQSMSETHVTYKIIYWYLDDIQMTTISRNDHWFNAAVSAFQEIWETIQRERISGYEHRAPKKRVPAEVITVATESDVPIAPCGNICVIKLSEEEALSD